MRKVVAALATAVLLVGALFATTFKATASSRHVSAVPQHISKAINTVAENVSARPFPKVVLNLTQTYQVRAGDSLSTIAGRMYGSDKDWPVLYWANRNTVKWANVIDVGWVLTVPPLPMTIPAAPIQLSAAVQKTHVSTAGYVSSGAYGHPNYCGDGDGDGWDVSCQKVHTEAASTYVPQPQQTYAGTEISSFQQCVIARESGGNSQVMNSTGHYGLYQFSESTWVAYGGNAASFGNASVAQQNQVFARAMATPGGASNWSPYDGC